MSNIRLETIAKSLLYAADAPERLALYARYPELLSPGILDDFVCANEEALREDPASVRPLLYWCMHESMARLQDAMEASDSPQSADALARISSTLSIFRDTIEKHPHAVSMTEYEPAPVRWAALAREQLATGKLTLSSHLLALLRETGEGDLETLIREALVSDLNGVDQIAAPLRQRLSAAGRQEEAQTVELIRLHLRASAIDTVHSATAKERDLLITSSIEACERSFSICIFLGDRRLLTRFLLWYGVGVREQGDLDDSVQIFWEARITAQSLGELNPEIAELAGEANLALGNGLHMQGQLEPADRTLQRARDYYQFAANHAAPGNPYGAAVAVHALGVVKAQLKMWSSAKDLLEMAVEEFRRLVTIEPAVREMALVSSLSNLGTVLRRLVLPEDAKRCFDEALLIQKLLAIRIPEKHLPGLAGTLSDCAVTLTALCELDAAIATFREALGIYESLPPAQFELAQQDLVMTLGNLGLAYYQAHRFEEAEDAYSRAGTICRSLSETALQVRPILGHLLNSHGVILRITGRPKDAEPLFREALSLIEPWARLQSVRYQDTLAGISGNLGNTLDDLGKPSEALEHHRRALVVLQELDNREPKVYQRWLSHALTNLGNSYSALHQLSEAETAYEEAIMLRRRGAEENPQLFSIDLARGLLNLANLSWERGNLDRAEPLYLEAEDILSIHPDPDTLASVLSGLGQLLLTQPERLQDATEVLQRATAVIEQLRVETLTLDRHFAVQV